jgi:N-acetylmuramoyl-L-alanine amidase
MRAFDRHKTKGWAAAVLAAAALGCGFLFCLCPAASAQQKAIVLDPGHGGLDAGAKGKFGAIEKDVVLAVSLKLKALIETNLDYRVVLTRDKDIDVSLDARAALANNNDAAVFISIHANGSFRKKAHGSETFFLSLNSTDEESRKLAYRENTGAEAGQRIVEDDKDLVQMILWDMAQSGYVRQSSRLAELIQGELNVLLATENRGIKQADFVVLRGVACPAVLVEAAFISNPEEEQRLTDDAFQDRVAEAVFRGLSAYLRLLRQD